jgi:DNA-nicking Smr family endonuclease
MSKRRLPLPPAPSPGLPDDEDRRLFERELADVRPLKPGPTRIPFSPPLASKSRVSSGMGANEQRRRGISVERIGGRVAGAAPGVSRQLLRVLGKGELAVEATCDLHGMRAEAARARLRGFIEVSAERGRHCVLIVCGRGLHSGPTGPVLLELTTEALGQPPLGQHVLAFATAPASHGGEGALVVRLRSKRPNKS